jgi:hypothetical protein
MTMKFESISVSKLRNYDIFLKLELKDGTVVFEVKLETQLYHLLLLELTRVTKISSSQCPYL